MAAFDVHDPEAQRAKALQELAPAQASQTGCHASTPVSYETATRM